MCSVLIGNVPGARNPDILLPDQSPEKVHAVQTRSSRCKVVHPLILPKVQPLNINASDFAKLQKTCPTLTAVRDKVLSGEQTTGDGTVYKYVESQGVLYRSCVKSKFPETVGKLSLVVPSDCRPIALTVAHDSPLAGHFSHRKTLMRIMN